MLSNTSVSSNLIFFEKSRLVGGERHPTPETGLSHIPAKNDIRKTAKAVMPLRFKESLFLLCRDLTSTFEVQSPLAVARIFLTGYPPILGMVYVSKSCCLKAIKIPPNFKSEIGECSEHSKSAHRNIVFFIRWACPTYGYIKNKADKLVIAHLFIGSASYASGSLMMYLFFPTNGNL